ncbi:MAG: spondin domain-containing protein [Cyclobacteriaceae bacterium]
MKTNFLLFKTKFIIALMSVFIFASCDDDDSGPDAVTNSFTVTISNVQTPKDLFQSGVFNTPIGDSSPGPATPGKSYEFSFQAGVGHRLSFATMYVQSNDLFFAPEAEGIALYDANGAPITGDITSMISLWDAGTEVNEEPGTGANQAPRQSGADTGTDEGGTVELIENVNDGFTYPSVSDAIAVTIANDGTMFTVTIENISGGSIVPSPLAPGGFAIHASGSPLFVEGDADFGNGLEAVAEDGDATALGMSLSGETGLITPFAPGAYAVHSTGMPLFISGQADLGTGLEAVAEDGNPATLASSLSSEGIVSASGAFNTPMGASAPAPIFPGESYQFTFEATSGDFLSLATMFIQSNDLFYAFGDSGLALFDANGNPVTGDVTASLSLWDGGTEVNEFPGAGPNQAPRQAGANTGTDETNNVQLVNDSFTYPSLSSTISVTISVN